MKLWIIFAAGLLTSGVQAKDIGWDIGQLKNIGLQGERTAQLSLGLAYSSGVGVKKNLTEAFYWYEKAAQQGDPIAAYYLARAYAKGSGTHRDPKQVIRWYREAAVSSNSSARKKLVDLLSASESGSPERAEAYAWCLVGTESGNVELQTIRDLLAEHEEPATLTAGKAKAIELQEAIGERADRLRPKKRAPRRGNFLYPTGERYFGQVRANRPHGHGIVVSPNGDRFYGEFKGGRANGYGVLHDKTGRVLFSGIWRNDKAIADDGLPLPLAVIGNGK